jgi:purine-nucleoside phosphorylase
MPIHVRAAPGDYAEAVLLPGDPLRAKYIADTYLDDVAQTNCERGMLGFRGTWEGKPVSVQSTGMGCPSAAIVIEELVMLGCKKLLRVGTCGGLQPIHVGPIVSSDVFYNPDGEQYQRWSDRGILAVEMEAAILFTLGALRKVHAGCLLTVSDIVVEGEFKRITDDELRAAVDRMTRVALATVTSDH